MSEEKKENVDKSSKVEAFDMVEVSQHKKDEDCWIVVHGKVYDISKYLDDHPGGPEIILDVAGTDATEDFEDTGHSEDARNTLKEYYIGDLKQAGKPTMTGIAPSEKQKESTNNTLMLIGFFIAFVAVLFALYIELQKNEGDEN
eukprot:snap_masked-scaffold_1-processed-gene-32.28-mRNA-1 protein AED:0.03 eAED:0.03 QI:0/-1/0/1/-1/1/1/0/143